MRPPGRGGKFGPNKGRKSRENLNLRDEEESPENALEDDCEIEEQPPISQGSAPNNGSPTNSSPISNSQGDVASSSGTKDDDKLHVWLENGFIEPSDKCSRKIRVIFYNFADKKGYDWKHAPMEIKEKYLQEFKRQCTWDKAIDALVRIAWNKKAKLRYRDMMHDVRAMSTKPGCISEEVWLKWREEWSNPEFKAKSAQNKKNRRSRPSLHTGGSITRAEHKRRLSKNLKRVPRIDELFDYLH